MNENEEMMKIENKEFYNCVILENVEIPNRVKSIGNEAFAKCKNLKSVTIQPYSFTDIWCKAFSDCTSLERVNLSFSSVKSIGKSAFEGCTKLKRVDYCGTKEQ